MLFNNGNQYTDTAVITDGISNFIEGNDVNNLITNIRNYINGIDTLVSSTTITASTALTANTQICVPVSAASGAVVITMPTAASQTRSPIFIKKTDVSANTVTVQRAVGSSDTFEDPTNPATTPSAASIVLRIPDEGIWFVPVGNTWRILFRYVNNRVAVSAYKSATQGLVANTQTKVTFDTDEYDLSSNHASSTFTAPYDGGYRVTGAIDFVGSANSAKVYLFQNGAIKRTIAEIQSGSSGADLRIPIACEVRLTAGQTLEIWAESLNVNRNIQPGPSNTYIHYSYLGY